MPGLEIIDTTIENVHQFGVCGYKNLKKPGFPEKFGWMEQQFREGLKIKTLISEKHGTQGMIEYIPGEFCWRPVNAKGYMFIHCIFLGFKKEYKSQGDGSRLLALCERDAEQEGMAGVAVVTRKGSFMAGNELFLKHGYRSVDAAPPDFELLVKNFNPGAPDPHFKEGLAERKNKYGNGLTIIRADQCPYTVKNVTEICAVAEGEFGVTAKIIDLQNYLEAQAAPGPFGTFCILYNGKIVAHHPVSSGRFRNIIKKILNP